MWHSEEVQALITSHLSDGMKTLLSYCYTRTNITNMYYLLIATTN